MNRPPSRSTRTDTLFPYTTLVRSLPAVAKTGALFVERSERWRLVFDSPNPVSGLNFESLAQGFENLAGIVDAIPADSRAQCFHPRLLELKRRCERFASLGGHRHKSGAHVVGIVQQTEIGRASCRERGCQYV